MSEQAQIPVAVVGAGYFGRFHAQQYALNPRAKLVAVIDADAEKAGTVAAEFGAEAGHDHRSLIGRVAAASVATSTPQHFEVASDLIAGGLHVLIEKPITATMDEAERLTRLADEKKIVLQVGHIERFSSSFRALAKTITQPLYFECYRIAPWKQRGIEVDVVLDLMIHDIDIVLGLAGSPVLSVDAVGTAILGKKIDMANARITFESGCVANVTASRVSYKTERRMRVFQRQSYIVCDLGEGKIFAYHLRGDPLVDGLAAIGTESYEIPKENSLANEIEEFLDCISTGRQPTVDGRAGSQALKVASMINDSIEEHLRRVGAG